MYLGSAEQYPTHRCLQPTKKSWFKVQTPVWGTLHFCWVTLPLSRHNSESRNWKDIQLAFMHSVPSSKTFLPGSTKSSFSSPSCSFELWSVCQWYYFDSSGNHLGAKKRRLPYSEHSKLQFPIRLTGTCGSGLKEAILPELLLRVTLIRTAREDGGHLCN